MSKEASANLAAFITQDFEGIEQATFDNPVVIVDEQDVATALERKIKRLRQEVAGRSTLVVPIAQGGNVLGRELAQALNLPELPFRMSYYDNLNQRKEKPMIVEGFDPDKVYQFVQSCRETNPLIVVAEAVVDSGATIATAIEYIRGKFAPFNLEPEIIVEAYVLKTDQASWSEFIRPAFVVPSWVWVRGCGCDDSQIGRELPFFAGRLDPNLS